LKTIGVVTVGRSDYGLYRPVLRRIADNPELSLRLIVAGAHLLPQFGMTVDAIKADGFEVAERIEMALASDSPEAVAKSVGIGVTGFAQSYANDRPDLLLVLGDRYEMLAAVVAALPFAIPIAHIHGGELTEGAIDEAIRHSITKMSHLHFAATDEYAQRITQLGEEPWRVVVSGAPGLDNLNGFEPRTRAELEGEFGLDLSTPPLLVTFHPVTLEYTRTGEQMRELTAALEASGLPIVITYPNADAGHHEVERLAEEFSKRLPRVKLVVNLGTDAYFSLMGRAAAMVGNSSSGIIEAASFGLPVVNIGNRQGGRIRAANVIDVECESDAIVDGIRLVTSSDFREGLAGLVNPYGDGHASGRIVDALESIALDDRLLLKRFHNIDVPVPVKTSWEQGAST
jgi:UDP-hydrolysing UDP-N-acetyl-D-glucosamine 2-epimerase